ncbi:MAG: hypothetical protein KJO63_10995 [Maribacter sp.]|nr:hypothetical protein [Maribacter sp.]
MGAPQSSTGVRTPSSGAGTPSINLNKLGIGRLIGVTSNDGLWSQKPKIGNALLEADQ